MIKLILKNGEIVYESNNVAHGLRERGEAELWTEEKELALKKAKEKKEREVKRKYQNRQFGAGYKQK